MNLTGQVKEIAPCFNSNKWSLTLYINEASALREGYDRFKDKDIDIKVTQHREKRSLNANAFYWELIGKLASALKTSRPELHNLMLRRYGVIEKVNGCLVTVEIPDTDEGERIANESETFHVKPTSQVRVSDQGQPYRTYLMIKGSHEYDTKEMSDLISGLVEECKAQGIETATPEEIERMLSLYEEKRLRNEKEHNAGS